MIESLESRMLLATDMVVEWNRITIDAIQTARNSPPLAVRNLAIVHAAIYDAVNSITGDGQPYLVQRHAPPGASPQAAAAVAAFRVLVRLFPQQQRQLRAHLHDSLSQISNQAARDKGAAVGWSVANQLLLARKHDGVDASGSYAPTGEPGDWAPTPPNYSPAVLPEWYHVTPFALASSDQFLPPPPSELASAEYAADFNYVKEIGAADSATRTADQTETAIFWEYDNPGEATPPGQWNQIAQTLAQSQHTTLAENARLFALLNIAMADAGIATWHCKYHYDFWRPITAVIEADHDGNAATVADSQWHSLLYTPSFPAYTSGHSAFGAAAATVFASVFGTDDIHFTVHSDELPGVTRSYDSFSAAAAENGISRIYGGIHWSFDNANGLATGEAVAKYVLENHLKPASLPQKVHVIRTLSYERISRPLFSMTPIAASPGKSILQQTKYLDDFSVAEI